MPGCSVTSITVEKKNVGKVHEPVEEVTRQKAMP
jgi:hypothetical protein